VEWRTVVADDRWVEWRTVVADDRWAGRRPACFCSRRTDPV